MSCCLFPFLDDYFSANLFPTINCHPARNVSPKVFFLSFNFLSLSLYLFAQIMKTRLCYKGPSRYTGLLSARCVGAGCSPPTEPRVSGDHRGQRRRRRENQHYVRYVNTGKYKSLLSILLIFT